MDGWYELGSSSDGQFHFVLKDGDAKTLLASELYKTRAAAENGIASIQSNCQIEQRFAQKESSNGKFYFTLKAANHQVIGTSHMYASAAERDSGIAAVKAAGITQAVKDVTKPMQAPPAKPGEEKRPH